MGLLLSYYRWFKLGPEDCTTAVPQRQWPAHNVWVDDIDHGEAGTLTLMRWAGMRLETRVFPRGNGKPLKPWMNSDIYRKWNLKAGDMCLIPFCFYFSSCWPLWLNSILLPLRVWVFFFWKYSNLNSVLSLNVTKWPSGVLLYYYLGIGLHV